MKTVFFYGLFMDEELLRDKGFHPVNPRIVYAEGLGLRVGEKAALVKSPTEKTYGVVMDLSEEQLSELYALPGVIEYAPETIEVTALSGSNFPAICYNLPAGKLTGTNKEYAQSLVTLAQKLGFPGLYIDHILSFT